MARDEDPVILTGSSLAAFIGRPLDEIGLFRFDFPTASFVPIAFQIDQRIEVVLNEGTPWEAQETLYDVQGTASGILETPDELVFMYSDAGSRAPLEAPWPVNAGEFRYEIAIRVETPVKAPRSNPAKWVYIFAGDDLPRSFQDYVSWVPSSTNSITSTKFALDFQGNWITSGLRIFSPCGSGSDLIDRLKGRALTAGGLGEDEEFWSTNSTFYGGKDGPIRAIRVVIGAASGLSTLLQDLVYRGLWEREVHLRVHAIPEIRFYFDWLGDSAKTMFTAANPRGVPIDGVPDSQVGTTFQNWVVVRTPRGGAVILYDLPDSPYFGQKEFFYRDDAQWNDALLTNPTYGDEDNSAYGAGGICMKPLYDSNPEGIWYRLRLYPLCAGQGDASVGVGFHEAFETPPEVEAEPQLPGTGSIRSLWVTREGADTLLTWDSFPDCDFYRVFYSPVPSNDSGSWLPLGETFEPEYRDTDLGVHLRFYSVVFIHDGQQGGW